MGYLFRFAHLPPSPKVGLGSAHCAHNRLPALMDVYVLHCDLLFGRLAFKL